VGKKSAARTRTSAADKLTERAASRSTTASSRWARVHEERPSPKSGHERSDAPLYLSEGKNIMPQTLAEKLAEAGAAIGDLEKIGDNGEYHWLRAYDVLKEVRRELFKRGIVIIPNQILNVQRSQPYLAVSDNIIDEVAVTVRYHVTDGTETIVGEGVGVGQDYTGKALYMALTGSLKFFCQTLGLIAGIPEDPNNVNEGKIPEGLAEHLDNAEKKFGPDLREHPISQRDVRAWGSACKTSGFSETAKKNYLKSAGVDKITDLKRKDFPAAIKWAVEGENGEAVTESAS
jgi:hypothetical protein